MVCIMLVTQTSFRLFIWRHNLKEQRKSIKHTLRPFLCSLLLSYLFVPRKQFFNLYCCNFPHTIRRGKVSDQTLFADEYLPPNHHTEDVASCHMAIEGSHRQAGQHRRQLVRQGIGMFAPTFCYVLTQCLCHLLRQYDGRCRRFVPLRRKLKNESLSYALNRDSSRCVASCRLRREPLHRKADHKRREKQALAFAEIERSGHSQRLCDLSHECVALLLATNR